MESLQKYGAKCELLLDTDIVVAHSMECLNVFQHAEADGVISGTETPRAAAAMKTKMAGYAKGKGKKGPRGGINGGVIVLKPSKQWIKYMMQSSDEDCQPPDNVEAEANFISEFYGL